MVVNSWVGRGAAGLHGGASAGARVGSFQWQHRGAGDGLIKTLTDGLGYGTHVCAQPHDAHPSQLMGEGHRPRWDRDAGCTAMANGKVGAASWALGLAGGHQPRVCWMSPCAEAGGPGVAD